MRDFYYERRAVSFTGISSAAAEIPLTGLTEAEAAARLEARGAPPRPHSSRSYASIIRANTLTIPNGILRCSAS